MATEIRVPALGELVSEATVGQWFKKVGDSVKADEPLVELETDKVTLEVPAPAAGVISAIEVEDGATVEVGAVLGAIDANGAAAKPREDRGTPAAAGAIDETYGTTLPIAAGAATIHLREAGDTAKGAGTASPAARKALAEAGVEPPASTAPARTAASPRRTH